MLDTEKQIIPTFIKAHFPYSFAEKCFQDTKETFD
jgi:hypothetical protein